MIREILEQLRDSEISVKTDRSSKAREERINQAFLVIEDEFKKRVSVKKLVYILHGRDILGRKIYELSPKGIAVAINEALSGIDAAYRKLYPEIIEEKCSCSDNVTVFHCACCSKLKYKDNFVINLPQQPKPPESFHQDKDGNPIWEGK